MGIVITLAAIVAFFFALFVLLHLYVYGGLFWFGFQLRNRLRKVNRVISLEHAKQEVEAGNGLLIVELPTLGWNVNRIWWEPNRSSVERAERLRREDDIEFCVDVDRRNHEVLLDEASGTSKLLRSFIFSQNNESFLRGNFGDIDVEFIHMGHVERELRREARESGFK